MNTITLSLSMPDRAALGRITQNIRDVATDIVNDDTTPDALAFAQLCRFALRWLDAATAAVERTFEVDFDSDDRAALTVCAPYLRRLAARKWSPSDWKKGELADWKVMWSLMLGLHDDITEAEELEAGDNRRPI
jgi:hypothetical protein